MELLPLLDAQGGREGVGLLLLVLLLLRCRDLCRHALPCRLPIRRRSAICCCCC